MSISIVKPFRAFIARFLVVQKDFFMGKSKYGVRELAPAFKAVASHRTP